MANFAPPICRDGFVYHGQLFADVGNLNRHPRASIQDLIELLRPNKPAKDGPSKDQVGHWYFAQLKHYGLPMTKDKNAAKVRLLNAINGGQIEVPKHVKKLETQLKKEYDAANKKARAELKGGEGTAVPSTATALATAGKTTTNKRKRGDEDAVPKKATAKMKVASTSTPMPPMPGASFSVGSNGGINVNIAYQQFLGNVGDMKTGAKKVKGKKAISAAKSPVGPKATTFRTTESKVSFPAKFITGSVKKPAVESTPSSKTSANSKNTLPKIKGRTKKNEDPTSNATTQRRTSGAIKQESDFLNPNSSTTPFDHGVSQFYNHDQALNNITGIYDVQCTIQEDFPAYCEDGCRLMLCREQSTGRVWGSFSWGPFFGVIQLNPGPSHFSRNSLSLGWRAKHLDTGDLKFGRGKTGTMAFRNADEISGQIFDLFGNFVEFFGRRRNGPANCGFSPAQFAAEWDHYPAVAYGRNQPSDRQSFADEPNQGEWYENEPDERVSYGSELDYEDLYDSEPPDGQLYNEDGYLNPTGRYEELMRQSLGGW